jgi:hypothetical protein
MRTGTGMRASSVRVAPPRRSSLSELFGLEASPGCTPVLDPLRGLRSYRELMRRYGIRVYEA